jgi:hypothetical protein
MFRNMKVEIEIPEEDIERLEGLLREHPHLMKLISLKGIDIRGELKLLFENIGRLAVKKLICEGLLGVSSGVITPYEFLGRMFMEGMSLGSEYREESDEIGVSEPR